MSLHKEGKRRRINSGIFSPVVKLKPLDISSYCKSVFEKCSKILIMSATILNHKAFCRSVGLSSDEVKFIQVQSDFPLEHRPIIPLNVAYLNYSSLQSA